jgi:hypothetical protein
MLVIRKKSSKKNFVMHWISLYDDFLYSPIVRVQNYCKLPSSLLLFFIRKLSYFCVFHFYKVIIRMRVMKIEINKNFLDWRHWREKYASFNVIKSCWFSFPTKCSQFSHQVVALGEEEKFFFRQDKYWRQTRQGKKKDRKTLFSPPFFSI